MEIRINKGLAIVLSVTLLFVYVVGFPLVGLVTNIIYPENGYQLTLGNIIIGNIPNLLTYLGRIVIGFWLFSRVEAYKLDKWTWLLIGLIFGKYSLVLWGINMITQGKMSKTNLFAALNPVWIVLILLVFIPEFLRYSTSWFMIRFANYDFNGFLALYNSYLVLVIFGFGLVLNILMATIMNKWSKEFEIKGRKTWVIATLFIGILPVILFKEFILISRNED